ncbi:MAG TPA: sulfate ABC transporter permease subunit CysT [Planctomycetota bacterium]|nr:sulfate ABC transporter permease subunit CysT [Planctomycetota bacterium]
MRPVKEHSILPGFGLTLGITLTYTSLLVLVPLGALILNSATMSFDELWSAMTRPRARSAYALSLGTAFIAALVNCVFGFVVAWVLVRYRFPGRRLLDALVDLPFALPTAVSGIALTTLFAEKGWLGSALASWGVRVAYSRTGIVVALIFIGLPFMVRTLQPAIEELSTEIEEAAASLGAGRLAVFRHVIIPTLIPALLTGFAMAFARGIGEYGSVVFIAGNMPLETEILPLLIVVELEQYDYAGATALGTGMLVISFVLLAAINLLERWGHARSGRGGG